MLKPLLILRNHFAHHFVAYIALFIALGGTAYGAAKWTGADIVDESLAAADLAPNSVSSSEIAPGAVGTSEVNDNSLTGADIDESTLVGLTGAVSGYEIVSGASAFDSSSFKSVNVACPSGKNALGGGAISTAGNVAALVNSTPTAGGSGWTAAFAELGSFEPSWFATVFAICADVAS